MNTRRFTAILVGLVACATSCGSPTSQQSVERSLSDLQFERQPRLGTFWPAIEWRVDLDELARPGTQPTNAGEWLAAFCSDGARHVEAQAGVGSDGELTETGARLLAEAEAWVDAGELRYPWASAEDVQECARPGPTRLLWALARAWIERGDAASDRDAALEDYRRVVRLGRLMMTSETSSMDVLVGNALIRKGAEAILDEALRREDARLAVVAALTLAEHQRHRDELGWRANWLSLGDRYDRGGSEVRLRLTRGQLQRLASMALTDAVRPFRLDAIEALWAVSHSAEGQARAEAQRALEAVSRADDPAIARLARSALEREPTVSELEDIARRYGSDAGTFDLPGWPAETPIAESGG